jgi:hypothetical protein
VHLLLSEQAYLAELDLSPFHPKVKTEERSCSAMMCVVKGEGRGHGRPLALVLGPGLRGLNGPWFPGFYWLGRHGPPKRLTTLCLEIPRVS